MKQLTSKPFGVNIALAFVRDPNIVKFVDDAVVKQGVKFSRINVYTRDKFTCQYCVRKFKMGELSYDHVTPRFAGGRRP